MTGRGREHEPLRDALVQLERRLADDMQQRWNRDLPLTELLVDRWERARRLGFDAGASVYDLSCVYGDVAVGRNTWIGPFTILDGTGGLSIGSNCSISSGVQIYTHDSVAWALSGGTAEYEYSPVRIGNSCYIGPNTLITRGVEVGDHCVVGAASLVNRDLPPFTVAFGTPCRAVGRVELSSDGKPTIVIDE